MKYQSQKVAYAYFVCAMLLFGIQVLGGLLAGWIYISPNFMSEILPFNVIRMIHTNALIVWLLLGFFGAAYFLVPEESEREIYSVKLAYLQLIILVVGTLGAVGGYLVGIHGGREFLEQPLWVKFGILVAALIFLFNISMTVLAGKKTAITNVLLMGLWLLSLLWIFAFINPDNLSLDKMYWWFVVHLWVEATWELVMASILAFLLLKLTGVDREVIEKWLYVIVSTALFSGILGTGHHFFWIGLPSYWLWIGSIFSVFEVIPFFLMMSFAFVMVWKGKRNHPNKAALLWALGSATVAFFGAGVWGFLHTLHGVNFYSHGTQITAAHGHLSFYGAYVAMNLAIITYAMPLLRGRQPYNQVLNMVSFWLMTGGMAFMTFVLTFAGTIQTHMQRVVGDYFMQVQDSLSIFYMMRFGAGFAVVIGAILFIYSQLVVRNREIIEAGPNVRGDPMMKDTIIDVPHYHPSGLECDLFETAQKNGLPLLLKGPTGCGKTRFVEHMAARLGRKLYTVACHDDLSAADLIGRYLLKGGQTVWVDGPLTRAVREGAICYLDEIVEARKDVTVVLHPLTDNRRTLMIDRTGEELTAPPEFMLVASYNPGYQNILKRMKPSTRQRFLSITFDFPKPDLEIAVVAQESGLDAKKVAPLVRLGGHIRALSGMDLEEGVSTRLLIYAATLIQSGMGITQALEAAIIEPLSDDEDVQTALRDLVATVYG